VNNADLFDLFNDTQRPIAVTVTASDYRYDGYLVSVFEKVGGEVRCVVEDDCRRLFIHNALQIREREK